MLKDELTQSLEELENLLKAKDEVRHTHTVRDTHRERERETHTFTHSNTHIHSQPLTQTHTQMHTFSHTNTCSLTHTLSHKHTHSSDGGESPVTYRCSFLKVTVIFSSNSSF